MIRHSSTRMWASRVRADGRIEGGVLPPESEPCGSSHSSHLVMPRRCHSSWCCLHYAPRRSGVMNVESTCIKRTPRPKDRGHRFCRMEDTSGARCPGNVSRSGKGRFRISAIKEKRSLAAGFSSYRRRTKRTSPSTSRMLFGR